MKIAIIGLGYVGLPLARLFATKYSVVGFDISQKRIEDLQNGFDSTNEISKSMLVEVCKSDNQQNIGLFLTSNHEDIQGCNFFIITVPTPVDKNNKPDLTPLYKASETVGKALKTNDIVVYESTVYPGATEEECIPILEKCSGLKFNKDFFAGYSPERINPGDKLHTVDQILKITSGSTPEIAIRIDDLYTSVIVAGTHMAPSIKVAEAAKVIENAQRDINIAFVNELAKIFNILEIDTQAVLAAASTKWNFLPFKPGLVGGHCIGVDPYYLAQKAQQVGYHPEIILAGRKLNDSMGEYVASQVVKLMIQKNLIVQGSKLLMLGITFKENCADVRNTKIVDVIRFLTEYGIKITIFDPIAKPDEVFAEYGLEVSNQIPVDTFDAIVLAVSHKEFLEIDFETIKNKNAVIYDVKAFLGTKADKTL